MPVKRRSEPIDVSEHDSECDVHYIRHICDSHVVLQFVVKNRVEGQRMANVMVKLLVENDSYELVDEIPLQALPYNSTGSCYVVLKTFQTVGTISTSFSCELQFETLRKEGQVGAPRIYSDSVSLNNIELSTSD